MTLAVITLLGSIVSFCFWLWKRLSIQEDDKTFQHLKRVQQAHSAIARGDADAVNRQLADSLSRLQAADRNPGGQDGNPAPDK